MGGFAWVTLATNDSYSLGALVLAHSLKQVGTKQQLVVLITPGISEPMRQKLATVFNVIQEVNILDSKDEANLKLLKRPELGITFTKLHCWRLTQFEKCVFLDADTLVVQNCDELFDRDEFSAAPDVGWPDCFNSGVFVYRPSNETYDKLVQFALDKGSFDGGDQGLLNLYFSDWSQKDITKHLPFIYNMCSTACYSYLPAFKQYGANAKIVHFIGASKPWLQQFDTLSRQVHPSGGLNHLQALLQKWWDIFCNLIHPELSSSMARSYTDFPSLNPSTTSSHPNKSTNIETPIHDYRDVWDPWEDYSESQTLTVDRKGDTEQFSTSFISHSSNISYQSVSQINTTQDLSPKFMPLESHNTYNHCGNTSSHTLTQDINQSQEKIVISCIMSEDRQSENVAKVSFEQSCVHNADKSETYSHSSKPLDPVRSEIINSFPEVPKSNLFSVTPDKTSENHQLPASTVYKDTIDEKRDKGLAGAFAQLTLGTPRSAEQIALEDQLRRQSWEVGNIDYLGRDSFDNIWSKICETLATCPAVQTEPEVAAVPPTTTEQKTEVKEQKSEEVPKDENKAQVMQPETAPHSEKPKDVPVLISPIPCAETPVAAPTDTRVATTATEVAKEVAKPITEMPEVIPEVVSTPKNDSPQVVPPVAPLPADTEMKPVCEAQTKEEQKLLETTPVISEVPKLAPAEPQATTIPEVQSTPLPLDAKVIPPKETLKDTQSSVEPPKQEQIPAPEQTKPADVQTVAATEVPKDEKKADVDAPVATITAATSTVELPKKETTAVQVEASKEEKTTVLAEAPKDDKVPAESIKDVKATAEPPTAPEATKESVTPVVTETPKDNKISTTEDAKATTPEVPKETTATPTEKKELPPTETLAEAKTQLPEAPVGAVIKPVEGVEKPAETAKLPPLAEKAATPSIADQAAPTESQQKCVAIPLGAPPSAEVPQAAEPVSEKTEPCKEVSKECPVVKDTAKVTEVKEVPKNVDTPVIKPENVPCKEELAAKASECKESAKGGEEVPVSVVAKASKECKELPECQTTCSKSPKCVKPDKESKQCSKSQPPKEDKKQIKEGAKVVEPQKESGDGKKAADQKPASSQEKEQKTSEASPAKSVETPTPPPRKQGNGGGKKTGKPKK